MFFASDTVRDISYHSRTLCMDSSDLFSHIQAPQVPVSDPSFDEPVEAPVFSDQPRRETRADSRST
ncbi:Uncharacterised protein [Mycolicibacterium aurum]|uniref:Uncharacterized protein n=1 Tax=Mycolicibacterium aurum TaxID=1791 RepID=A0A448IGX7_MYCAU|nr:Uncharacterised protein [Mycolicibacterium aurum]